MRAQRRDVERLRALGQLARLVSDGVGGQALLAAVTDTVARAFGFVVALNLHRPGTDTFEVVAVHGSDPAREVLLGTTSTAEDWQAVLNAQFEVEGCYFIPAGSYDWSAYIETTFVSDKAPMDRRDAWQPEDALMVPLRHSDGHLLGVLSLDQPANGLRPQASDLSVLAAVAALLAQALETSEAVAEQKQLMRQLREAEKAIREQNLSLERTVAKRTRELEQARVETLQRLALAAEYRDDQTHRHTERVGALAAMLARGIRLSDDAVAVIRRAAPLHDIGKVGVSDTILLKRSALTARELKAMQAHTTIGARILAGSRSHVLRVGRDIALSHHERWDGGGYPQGLAGEAIPISGRVTALADVFDALTHTRPYKDGWPMEEAIDEIIRLSGSFFDPRVVEAFLALDPELLASLREVSEPALAASAQVL